MTSRKTRRISIGDQQKPERWNKRFGLQNTDIDTADEIWKFFKLHRKNG